ncbi:hypothetical protein V8C34DRAFT_306684 [Trichoderma compactum]
MATTIMEDGAITVQASVADTLKLIPNRPWFRDANLRRHEYAMLKFCNPIALDALGCKYYCVYAGWLVLEFATVYFLLPRDQGFHSGGDF